MRHIVAFDSLIGKDKVYVDADKVEALAYGVANQPSRINGATIQTQITQLLGAGWQLVTSEKIDAVRRKLGWVILDKDSERAA